MKFNISVNYNRHDAIETASDVIRWLQGEGIDVEVDAEALPYLDVENIAAATSCRGNDLAIAFGGDGTVIRAVHRCSKHNTPVLGVYFGQLGFMTQCDPTHVFSVIKDFIEGKLEVEDRMMAQIELYRNDKHVVSLECLNELAIHRDAQEHLISLSLTVNDIHLTSYAADGVLISTPTGSTAYNLSCGGPLMDPTGEAIIVTAICPHTLSARPLVLAPTSHIELSMLREGSAVMSCDGLHKIHVFNGDVIKIKQAERKAKIVRVRKDDFLVKLRSRLFWSLSIVKG